MHLDIVWKAFVGVLAAVVIIGSGLGVTMAFSHAVAADNYMESVSKKICEVNEMKFTSLGRIFWGQDGTVYNGYIFRFNGDGTCKVYKLSDALYNVDGGELTAVSEFPPTDIGARKI